ncbi:AraC family transcriptional regulator [Thalassospira marina]|uniref:HTH araC/xylS-type domain-containing protein n=1 Tax=Thalassospira marina TaxID=2048283 RepID=A0A2N3KBX3_9PROT|nr:AraC family transcriptional regulator [Thalassospira marina]PKR48045.1 hypothetical protein COO20_25175 [Thalassospira marina]
MARERIVSSSYWRDDRLNGVELFAARFRAHQYRRHSHEGYVIAVITEGTESFFCRGAIHVAGPGDIILINPQSQHDGEAASDSGWAYRVLYPTEQHFMALGAVRKAPRFAQSVVHDPELAGRIAGLHQAMEGVFCEIAAHHAWSGILWDLMQRYGEDRPENSPLLQDRRRIARIEEILRTEMVTGITLDDVASRVGWTQWHLIRAFKAAKGTSPHAYLLECRLRYAKSLIDTGEPIAMAASAAGFVDQSHFARNFVSAYGFTPGSYQRSSNRQSNFIQ